jgi:hypothetical protein
MVVFTSAWPIHACNCTIEARLTASEIEANMTHCCHFSCHRADSASSRASTGRTKGGLCSAFEEADARTRTGDPFITSEVLYQLSYVGRRPTLAA